MLGNILTLVTSTEIITGGPNAYYGRLGSFTEVLYAAAVSLPQHKDSTTFTLRQRKIKFIQFNG